MTRSSVSRPSAERSLPHCSFSSEKNQRSRRQAYHSFEESLLPSQSLSICHVITGRPVHELNSLGSSRREKSSPDSENEQIRILLERQKEQILADCRAEISLNEMEELKRFQGSAFGEFSRRRLIEDRDAILELTAKIQELQNEVNCMNDLGGL